MLFKAKKIRSNKWMTGYLLKSDERYFIAENPECDSCRYKEPDYFFRGFYEICQNTICRRVDLDTPKPFWENDIITDGKAIGVIRYGLFNSKHLGFYIEWQGKYHDRWNDVVHWLPMVKVIGNAIDDPELLKVGDT